MESGRVVSASCRSRPGHERRRHLLRYLAAGCLLGAGDALADCHPWCSCCCGWPPGDPIDALLGMRGTGSGPGGPCASSSASPAPDRPGTASFSGLLRGDLGASLTNFRRRGFEVIAKEPAGQPGEKLRVCALLLAAVRAWRGLQRHCPAGGKLDLVRRLYESATYALRVWRRLGCNWVFAVWLGWCPWEAASGQPWWCHRLGFSTSRDKPPGGQLAAVRAASPFGAARQPRSVVLLSGSSTTPCASKPAAALRSDLRRSGPQPRAFSENAGWCCATPLPNCPLCRLLTITASPCLPLIGGLLLI